MNFPASSLSDLACTWFQLQHLTIGLYSGCTTSPNSAAVNHGNFAHCQHPYRRVRVAIMPQPLGLLGQRAPRFNPVLYGEAVSLAAL